jgi:hypothetical protein
MKVSHSHKKHTSAFKNLYTTDTVGEWLKVYAQYTSLYFFVVTAD